MVDGDDTKQPPSVDNTTSNLSIAKKVDVTQSQSSIANSTSSISASLADVITAKATSITSVSTAMQIDTPTTEVTAKPSTNELTSNDIKISNDAPTNNTQSQKPNILDAKSYYTQIKTQLLSSSTSISTRHTTLKLVTNLISNDVILNPDKISHDKLGVGKSQQDKEKENKERKEKENNKATSYLLSVLLPTILKIIISPNGKANSMLNNVISAMDSNGSVGNMDQGGKGGKKKKESKKRKKDKISKDGDVTNVTGGVSLGVANVDGEMTLHPPSSSTATVSTALSSGKAVPSSTNPTPASSNQSANPSSANPASANPTATSSATASSSTTTSSSTTATTTTIPKIKTPTCYISPNSNIKSINNECRYMLLILLDRLLSLVLPSTATGAATGALGSSLSGSSSSISGMPSGSSTKGTSSTKGGISATKREQHINTIQTILIHVIIEDYEINSILANGILLRLLQRSSGSAASSSTNGGGGLRGAQSSSISSNSGGSGLMMSGGDSTLSKMQTCEYQMLINYTIDLYKALGGSGAKSKTNLSKRFDLLGDGKGKKKSTKKTTPGGGTGGGSGASPVKTSPVKASPVKTETEAGASGDSTPSSTPAVPTSLRSNQSYKVLSELPTTILHIMQLHPKQLLKNNISSLTSVMMDLLKLVPPSSPASSSSSGGSASTPSKKGGSAPKVTTPSLSTPKLPPKLVHSVPQGSSTASVKTTTTTSSPTLAPLGDIMSTPDKNEDEEEEATLVQRKLQHYQTTLVSFIAAQVKALSFMVHLIRTSSSAANSSTPELKRSSTTLISPNDQVNIIDAAFKSYEESLGTFVIQILRSTSSSSFVDISSSSSTTKQQQQLASITIQLRREVLINTRYLLLSSTAGGDTSSSSSSAATGMNFRRGFYKHADTMLEERTLLGTSRLSSVVAGGSTNNWEDDHEMMGDEYHSTSSWGATSPFSKTFSGSFTSLQPLGYSILAEYCSRISTKMTLAQMSRAILIFSRVLHCDLPLITIHEEGGNIQLLPNFTTPYSEIQVLAVKWLLSLPQIIMYNRDPNPQIGRDILNRILQTCVRKLEVVSSYTPIILDAVEKEMKERVDRYRQQRQQQGNDNADVNTADARSSSLLAILLNLQHLVKPIMSGIKAMFYCLSTYSNNRQNELQRSMEAGEEQFIYPISPSADDLGELAYSGGRSAKLMIDERKTLDKFLKVGLGCCRLFTVNVTELERFFNQMDDGVEGLDDIFSSSSSVSSMTSASTNNHKKSFIHRRHKDILELYAVSFTSLETHSFRKLMSNTNIHYIVQTMGEHDDSNILHVFTHLLLMTGKAVSIEFATLVMGYLMERGVNEWVQYETKEKKEEDAMEIESSSSSKPTTLTKHSNNLSMLFNFVFASVVKYPRNEAILLPHLQKLIKGCFQKAMAEVPPLDGESGFDELVWPGPCLNIVRHLFRTLTGGKFEASYKEILPLVPNILNTLYRLDTLTYTPSPSSPSYSVASASLHHTLIELCIQIPCRLALLLPHLPLLFLMIIKALESKNGHLINLGLRTLEFYLDNLHADYILGLLSSMDTTSSTAGGSPSTMHRLLTALTNLLQPALSSYGMLSQRLLGKMGGINRLYLRETIALGHANNDDESRRIEGKDNLSLTCEWPSSELSDAPSFRLPLPLDGAVDILRRVAMAPCLVNADEEGSSPAAAPSDSHYQGKFIDLLTIDPRSFDNKYSIELMEETKSSQSRSSFVILKTALASIIDIDEKTDGIVSICTKNGVVDEVGETTLLLPSSEREQQEVSSKNCNTDFKLICDGLYAASVHKNLKEKALVLLKGLGSHVLYYLLSHRADIVRIDRDNYPIDAFYKEEKESSSGITLEKYNAQNHIEKLQPLKPFGCYRFADKSDDQLDPFLFNEALADAFTNKAVKHSHVIAMEVMNHVIELFHRIKDRVVEEDDDVEMKDNDESTKDKGGDNDAKTAWGEVLFENLLHSLAQALLHSSWNLRQGLMKGLFALITKMGYEWAQQYEVEILQCAMFVVKDTPDGIAIASEQSVRFFLQVSWFFFDGPSEWKESNTLVRDVLCPMLVDKSSSSTTELGETTASDPVKVKVASLTLILSEITSKKPLVRFVVRHTLRMLNRDGTSLEALLTDHVSSLKKLLFPKLLRILPLPNQCAVTEACAFILNRAPKLIPITDKSLLGFIAELLKMISIADQHVSDPKFGSCVLIDKNGLAVKEDGTQMSHHIFTVQPSSLFLRKSMVLEDESFGGRIEVPAELTQGVQLRVSTLQIFEGIIRGNPDEFYDALPESNIGNLRPHALTLMLRSLIADPIEVCIAGESALRSALSSCEADPSSKETEEGSVSTKQSDFRLSKELIQESIKPVLISFKSVSQLSVPLMRGLSRLLGLLSSWFNRSFGDKCMDHLKKFSEPDKIMQLQVFESGEEPLVAASVMELFLLLPGASQYVEDLVRVTLQLESVMYKYNPESSSSPFRKPLASFLNKHYSKAAGFFLEEHRLCNPYYNTFFQDLLRRDDTEELRKYIANSATLQNICFETPLAILRGESSSSSSEGKITTPAVYGIDEWSSPSGQRQLEIARETIQLKKKTVMLKSQDEARAKKALQAKVGAPEVSSYHAKAKKTREALEKAKTEVTEAWGAYTQEVSKANQRRNELGENSMGVSHLELQKQGFKIVKILASLDPDYLQDNSINRMLRWLWRSRGRHLRLIHDESVPPRYHEESRDLGQFLVNYSRAHPNEVDVLFDLIRIFIHPVSTEDFSFIKEHLIKRVSSELSVEQKRLVLQRFSKLLSSGQGNLETKLVAAQILIIPMLTDSRDEIFNDPSMKTLIESILSVTSSRRLETKMTCELLQITDLLLKKMLPDDISGYRRELLKWIWDVLKVNDPSMKYYAFLAVSRFICVFETPSKVSVQVLKGLYRCGGGQHDSLVQMSLDVLLPVLQIRLDEEEFETSMQYVLTIMKEEERPLPQQITLWESVTKHSDVYVEHKNEITPHMLHFIKLLGQHASVEHINLVVALSSLFIKWNVDEKEPHENCDVMNILIEQAFMMITTRRPDQSIQRIRAQILSVVEAVVSSSKCSGSAINSAPFENVLVYIKERHQDDTEEGSDSKKSGKSSRKDSHSSSKHEHQIEANALLLCAEIILILLRCDPKNDFLGLKVCSSIINQCMSNVMSSTSEHSKLAKILEDVFSHILVSEETSDGMTASVIAILEIAIRLSVTSRSSCFVISVIEKLWKTNQDFIEPLTGTLASVASQLVDEHINEVLATDSNEHPNLLAATPTQGILEEACNIGVVKSSSKSTGDDVHKYQIIVQNEALSSSLNSVISIMTMLSSSDVLLTFSNTRNMMLTTLSSILDRSNSLPLLLSAVSIVGNWLLSDDQTRMPLTRSEREGFVLQLGLFDFSRLPKASSPLGDLISCIALKSYGYGSSDSRVVQQCKGETMQKVLVSCLFSANPHIREVSLDMFMSASNKCIEDILKKILELDFEGVGQYMWTTVISDILLASCKSENISQGHLRLNHHDEKQEHATEVDTSTNDGHYSCFTNALALERNSSKSSCLAAIRSLVQGGVNTSESMLYVSFQAAWRSLTNSSRTSVMTLLEHLLAKPFHSQQCGQKNAIQSMLRLLVKLHPTPMIDPFLLQSLAADYNVSSEVLYLFEGQYVSLKTNGYDKDSSLLRAIRSCYKQLGERDVCLEIESSSAMTTLPGTKFALSLAMYDYVEESSNAFLSLIDQVGENDDDLMPTECEMALWEERLIETQREMGQWSAIDSFATSTQDTSLMLECALNTNEWDKVTNLFTLPSVNALLLLEDEDVLAKTTDMYLALHEGRFGEIESKYAQASELCLKAWSLLPSVGAKRNKESQLQHFTRLCEVRESSKLLIEAEAHMARQTVPDIKPILKTWKHRPPNNYEPLSVWNDLFHWRFNVYDAFATKFSWTSPATLASLHDRPFAGISISRTARKQGLKQAAAFSIDSLPNSLDLDSSLLKLREQVLNSDSLQQGLSLVSQADISYYDPRQKAEVFRLKAFLHNARGEKPMANLEYGSSVQISPNYARAWVDWGTLCASLSPDDTISQSESDTDSVDSTNKKNSYLIQAMSCFLEAVRCDPNEQSRDYLPHCLSMLSKDGPTFGNLCRTFETRSAVLPAWVWLPWIPQLLSNLCRVEAQAMKAIFVGILKNHPQALYFNLRSFYLERKASSDSKKSDKGETNASSRYSEEFMSILRKVNPVLWSNLEAVLDDLIIRFRPSYEVELLQSLAAILKKASSSGQLSGHTVRNLSYIGSKFFGINKEEKKKEQASVTRKLALFRSKYSALYKSDFLEGGEEEPDIDDIIAKLEKWKRILENGINRLPKSYDIREVSATLSSFTAQAPDLWPGACESKFLTLSNAQYDAQSSLDNTLYRPSRTSVLAAARTGSQAVVVAANSEGLGGYCGGGAAAIEIPGQYAPSSNALDSRPYPELHAKLVRFDQRVLRVKDSSTKHHAHQVTMIGSNGKKYRFLLQICMPYSNRTDERAAQLNYIMGKTLRRDTLASRKGLTTSTSVVIPIAQRMRMAAIEPSHKSLDSVSCHVQGTNKVAELLSSYQEQMPSASDQEGEDNSQDAKLKVYHDICQKLALPNIMSTYMREKIPSIQHLLQFRQTFTSQLAVNSLLQYAMSIVERTPNKFIFCDTTGQVLSQDFRSKFALPNGVLEQGDGMMPFRLTRNITEFIGPFLLEGVFIPSFATTSLAMKSNKQIQPILHLLFRDDLIAWYLSKTSPQTDKKMQEMEYRLNERIWSNVRIIQDRFEECSPRKVDDAASEASMPNPTPIDMKVRTLVETATSAEKLSMMPPEYEAWL